MISPRFTFRFLLIGLLGGLAAARAFASEPPAQPIRTSAPAFTAAVVAAPAKPAHPTRKLEETELLELLTATLQRDYVKERGELELRLTRPWADAAVPEGQLTVKVLELPVAGVTPNFILRFELRAGTELAGRFQLPLQARVVREVWVAAAAVPRGTLLRDADLTRERRDILTLRDLFAAATLDNPSLELAEHVSAGMPLTARSVRPRPVVQRGKVVDAFVTDGALLISVKVEVLDDGLPGQFVRVRNLKSKREFRGKVQNEESVLVTL